MRLPQGDHWVPSKAFQYQSADIRQFTAICKIGESGSSNHTIDLFLCSLLHIWIQKHCEKETEDRRDRLHEQIINELVIIGLVQRHTVSAPAKKVKIKE